MIFPIRCVTCNKVIGDKWIKYQKLVSDSDVSDENSIISIHVKDFTKKSKELLAFEKLGIRRYCCRRHFLSHIDLIDEI